MDESGRMLRAGRRAGHGLETKHFIESSPIGQTRSRPPESARQCAVSPALTAVVAISCRPAEQRSPQSGGKAGLTTSPSLSFWPTHERGPALPNSTYVLAVRRIHCQFRDRGPSKPRARHESSPPHQDPVRSGALVDDLVRPAGAAAALGTILPSRSLVCHALTLCRRLAAVSPG